jgi:hypothetical protein
MNRPTSQYSPGWRASRRFLERVEDGSAVGLGTLTGTGYRVNPAGTLSAYNGGSTVVMLAEGWLKSMRIVS